MKFFIRLKKLFKKEEKGPFDDYVNEIAEKLFLEKKEKGTISKESYTEAAKKLLEKMSNYK